MPSKVIGRTPRGYVVRQQDGSQRWAIYRHDVLIEGGFFSASRAIDAANVHDREAAPCGVCVDASFVGRVLDYLHDVYNAIGFDAFDGELPNDEEFVDVLKDQFGNFLDGRDCPLLSGDVDRWQALSDDEKRDLILRVGP